MGSPHPHRPNRIGEGAAWFKRSTTPRLRQRPLQLSESTDAMNAQKNPQVSLEIIFVDRRAKNAHGLKHERSINN